MTVGHHTRGLLLWLFIVIDFVTLREAAVMNQDPAGLPPPLGLAPKGDASSVPQATSAVNTAAQPSQEAPQPLAQPTLQWPPPPDSAAAQQHQSQTSNPVPNAVLSSGTPSNIMVPPVQLAAASTVPPVASGQAAAGQSLPV
eukprot:CAMPEP_0206529098 /NCGR_PEP_ID=MMETSP0325_2-20121206/2390_1 /ASSEMBLY_ACC=CAM_ASM_000347 /TAXON_ID=2866 /ORGANISM="Crypthecodinium cohnii, Strain Seligo" /LENGTH=141 /DNA_ID=CAMNT_0054024931 /DNA_START=266 /DNA_END=688 /DNA_ORIENTATION=-